MTALISITIKNFRGFEKTVSFCFDQKPLVLLTAPNGKGKTTLIDAVEWCLTGDLRRLHQAYDVRNPNAEGNLKSNEKTILKNKKHLNETTNVTLHLEKDHQMYSIIRTQDKDTLDDRGQVQVNDRMGEDAQQVLDSLVDHKNFYKYHVCDMQKTYNFLRTGRSEMSREFSDFTADHSTAEYVADNLNIYRDDIDQQIKCVQTVPEPILKICRDTLEKYEKSPEILPYESRLLYPSEQTDLKNRNFEQLNEHLRKLYSCGYAYVVSLLEGQQKGAIAKERKEELDTLQKEFLLHSANILEAAKTNAYKSAVRKKSAEILQKYSEIDLTADNLAGNSEELLKIGSITLPKNSGGRAAAN